MDYKQSLKYLEEISGRGIKPGLDTVRALLTRLLNPQNRLKFVHIAGTNGKGSVSAFLSNILSSAGLKTGTFNSPALVSVREMIKIDGREISEDDFAKYLTDVKSAAEAVSVFAGSPTRFEMETALAFLYFCANECDIVVLEAGMGGKEDATNIISTGLLEIITPVAMDHTEYLGNTLEKIAENKAGIIKPGTIVISARQERDAELVIENACNKNHCELRNLARSSITGKEAGILQQSFCYRSGFSDYKAALTTRLTGSYQFENAALAAEAALALKKLGYAISGEAIKKGLFEAEWFGRFTVAAENPLFIVDGAHNPAAAAELAKSIESTLAGKRLIFILGIFRDKDIEEILRLTAAKADLIIVPDMPENKRLMRAEELKNAVIKYNKNVCVSSGIDDAVKTAYDVAGKDDVILAFGSLSFLGEAARLTKLRGNKHES